MADNVSVILHWNTDYAEIPRKELVKVVETSYEPMVAAIENWKEGTICFNITGHTIEYLDKEFPELNDRIKTLANEKVVELLATGYSHPILPLLPMKRAEKQLQDHMRFIEIIYGKKPQGIWPPELAVTPSILKLFKENGINWTVIDYEHYLLAQWFGNDLNPFEKREQTMTEVLVKAFWSKGLRQIREYLRAYRKIVKANKEQINPLRKVRITDDKDIKGYLSSVSWTYSTQFAIGGTTALHNTRKHLKMIRESETPLLPLYGSDIEFFGYRDLASEAAKPKGLIDFLRKLKKHNIGTVSPSQMPEESWPQEADYICAGSWAPDKSFRIWTDSEDNTEFTRRAEEIYDHLERNSWDAKLIEKVEPYLRIFENSDPRGWAPLPERKLEAYSAMLKIYEILGI